MVERLRALLEHPLDPRVARAVVTLASVVSVGFGVLIALGVSARGGVHAEAPTRRPAAHAAVRSALAGPVPRGEAGARTEAVPPRQDPQDRAGTAARAQAERELERHLALQHLPYRRGGIRIDLVGARGDRAVLAIRAPTLQQARRGYRVFLHRYGDEGRSYLSRFRARRDHHG